MPTSLNVLLVEDSEDDAMLLLRELRKGGYAPSHRRVDTPQDMEEALERGSWDLVISDYNMPCFDGMAALRIVLEKGLDLPFIVVSGAIGEETAVEILRAGAGDFIKKGNWARLLPAIGRELREAEQRREGRLAEKARAAAEARYRSLFENAVEGIFQSTAAGRFLSVNPAMARIHGYDSPEEMIRSVRDIEIDVYVNPVRRKEFLMELRRHGSVSFFEAQFYRKDRTVIWVNIHARAFLGESGEIRHIEGMLEDITERKKSEEQLFRNAFYDGLTGLPNRALFLDRLSRAVERCRRAAGPEQYLFAVLFMDLDRFKTINDSLGHQAGDELLVAISDTLKGCVRAVDSVARFGGDEFAVLLEDLTSFKEAARVARRIQKALASPLHILGREVFTSASIGIVLGNRLKVGAEEILRDADIAMYTAKSMGRNRFKLFNKKMRSQAQRQLEIETDLRNAIKRQELRLHFQPIVTLPERRLVGLEALIRWQHPERGLVLPGEFIPLAEDTGLVVPLGLWVLQKACRQLRHWEDTLPGLPPLSISVNLSGKQLAQTDLVEQVRYALAETGLSPERLKLEITESVLMANAKTAASKLEKLKDLGVKLSIDDFGTGYSSLSYLHRFPIDTLKIDRSFVSSMGRAKDKEGEIVRTIVALAHNMGMDVVAEGVETRGQFDQLVELECECGQGYLFAHPAAAPDIEALLAGESPADPRPAAAPKAD